MQVSHQNETYPALAAGRAVKTIRRVRCPQFGQARSDAAGSARWATSYAVCHSSKVVIVPHYLVGPERDHGDGAAIVVGKLDFVHRRGAVEDIDDSSHCPGGQVFSRHGFSELNHVVQL